MPLSLFNRLEKLNLLNIFRYCLNLFKSNKKQLPEIERIMSFSTHLNLATEFKHDVSTPTTVLDYDDDKSTPPSRSITLPSSSTTSSPSISTSEKSSSIGSDNSDYCELDDAEIDEFIKSKQLKTLNDCGGCGKIYLMDNGSFGTSVIKFIRNIKKTQYFNELLNIHEYLATIHHENVVRLLKVAHSTNLTSICIQMSYNSDCIDLFEHVVQVFSQLGTVSHWKVIAKQILCGITFLHDNKIIHRDIKPENILVNLSNTNVVIIDFDSSVLCSSYNQQILTKHQIGTTGFISPECFIIGEYHSYSTDYFSFGATLFFVAFNKIISIDDDCVIDDNAFSELIEAMSSEVQIDQELKNIIIRCLKFKNTRIGINELTNLFC